MSKTLRDYITDPRHLEIIGSSNKWSDRDIECAKSWMPTFKERLPDIYWALNINQRVTITDGEFHFIVGEGGCLYVRMCNGVLKAGHIFEMGTEWAAKLFEDPYFVSNGDVEWDIFFTYTESYLKGMYQRKLEKDLQFEREYAAATLAFEEVKKLHPTAQLVIHKSHHNAFPEVQRHIFITLKDRVQIGRDREYMKDIGGTWYRGECFDGYQEWQPINIHTLEIDHNIRDGSPRWIG